MQKVQEEQLTQNYNFTDNIYTASSKCFNEIFPVKKFEVKHNFLLDIRVWQNKCLHFVNKIRNSIIKSQFKYNNLDIIFQIP